jgi:hypothetical protein
MIGHTPGPWHTDDPYFIYVWGADQQMVADLPTCDEETYLARMRGVGRGATEDEQRANARLIAAAPDLLEVCKRGRQKLATYQHVYEGDKELRSLLSAWDAAIAKAEGK